MLYVHVFYTMLINNTIKKLGFIALILFFKREIHVSYEPLMSSYFCIHYYTLLGCVSHKKLNDIHLRGTAVLGVLRCEENDNIRAFFFI